MISKKISLGVGARFLTDGTVIPQVLYMGDQKYEIDRVMNRGKCHPQNVPCIAPHKYVIIVNGQMKFLYFEPSTLEWFTVKEVAEESV